MEHHHGILRKVSRLKNETLEEQCKQLLNVDEFDDYYESYQEMFESEFYKKYVIYNDMIYKVEAKQTDPYGDIFVANKNSDGTINFEVQYYNGGCGFSEAIDIALNNMSRK
jgi:hypothetical protein